MEPDRNLLTTTVTDDGTIKVTGDIDMSGGPILEAAMLDREAGIAAAAGEHQPDLVVDVAAVHFIDSSGLRSLLAAARRAETRGASLQLHWVGPEIIRLFEITGTTEQFTIASRRD
jgi:anti-sigma B factor antagonist